MLGKNIIDTSNVGNSQLKEISKLEEYIEMMDNSIQCLAIFQDDCIVLGNRTLSEATGYGLDEIYNVKKERLSELAFFEDKTEDLWETIEDLTLNNCPAKESELCLIHKDGSKHRLRCYFAPITYQSKPAVQASFIDITKRKKAEKEAEKKEQELRAVQRLSKIANFNMNLKTGNMKATPEFFSIVEQDPKSFKPTISSFHKIIHPDDREHYRSLMKNLKKEKKFKVEHRLVMPDGNIKDVISHGTLKYSCSDMGHLLGYMQDVTAIRRYEEKLKTAVDEKELLIREVHHRVKNNLQIIMSLINLQSRSGTENPDDILKNIQSKIKSMALIHEKFYQSPELTRVNIQEYIKTFTIDIFHLYDVKLNKITLNTEMEDIEVGIDTAIPLGLIISEIVTNIIKYAFPQNQKGTIEIHLYSQIDQIVLKISDNGVGIPEKINIETPETLGLTIIKALTTQLDGTIQLEKNPGTTYTITFKEQKYKKRT